MQSAKAPKNLKNSVAFQVIGSLYPHLHSRGSNKSWRRGSGRSFVPRRGRFLRRARFGEEKLGLARSDHRLIRYSIETPAVEKGAYIGCAQGCLARRGSVTWRCGNAHADGGQEGVPSRAICHPCALRCTGAAARRARSALHWRLAELRVPTLARGVAYLPPSQAHNDSLMLLTSMEHGMVRQEANQILSQNTAGDTRDERRAEFGAGGGALPHPFARRRRDSCAIVPADHSTYRGLSQLRQCGLAKSGQFQMFVGTSTGAIVAAGLKLGMPTSTVIGYYRDLAGQIFKSVPLWDRYFGWYSSERLKDELHIAFHKFYGHDPTWKELADKSPADVTLMLVLWDVSANSTTFLSTDLAKNEEKDKLLHGARLSEIVTACCSAPTYFAPRKFRSSQGTERVYCDGGITGLNNPSAAAAALVWEEVQKSHAPLHVISLGAGRTEGENEVADIQTGLDMAVKNTIDALFGSTEVLMDQFYERIGGAIGIERYFRADPIREKDEKLDCTKLDYLQKKLEGSLIRYKLIPGEPKPSERLNEAKIINMCREFGFRSSNGGLPYGTYEPRKEIEPTVKSIEFRGNPWLRRDFRYFVACVASGLVVFLLLAGGGWLRNRWERQRGDKLKLTNDVLDRANSKAQEDLRQATKKAEDATNAAKEQTTITRSLELANLSTFERNKSP